MNFYGNSVLPNWKAEFTREYFILMVKFFPDFVAPSGFRSTLLPILPKAGSLALISSTLQTKLSWSNVVFQETTIQPPSQQPPSIMQSVLETKGFSTILWGKKKPVRRRAWCSSIRFRFRQCVYVHYWHSIRAHKKHTNRSCYFSSFYISIIKLDAYC